MRLLPPLLLGLLAATGCDRRLEPYVPLEQEPAPVEGPIRVPGLDNPVPREPILTSPARPPASRSAGASIRGVVRLADGVEARPTPGGALFVIARSPGGGPPLAALRLDTTDLPQPFEIGPGDVMIPGRPFVGPILLEARLDADGDPLTRSPRDLVASVPDALEPGASGVDLQLSPPES